MKIVLSVQDEHLQKLMRKVQREMMIQRNCLPTSNPGEEGQGLDVEMGPGLHHFSVKIDEHSVSIGPGVKPSVLSFVPLKIDFYSLHNGWAG